MNGRDHFLAFLSHPELTCHSSRLECSMKVISAWRKSSGVSRSHDNAHAIVVILSIIHTLHLNGINEVAKYLLEAATYVMRTGGNAISLQSSFYAIARAQKLMQESTSVSQTPRKSLVAMGNDGIYALTDTVPEGQRDETASNWCAATEVKSPAAT